MIMIAMEIKAEHNDNLIVTMVTSLSKCGAVELSHFLILDQEEISFNF